ncbi:MAG: DUF255 domain-containing protein [Rhodobacterales bacterium]|nr:DUF255 domain-containing protein [Rhodobacterales bacterium]
MQKNPATVVSIVLSSLLWVASMLTATGGLAEPRTHLEGESSLYLQQHTDNTVDWYPWGPEALEKARNEGKLIFVSVGYSSCHWCHVMREESFEDAEVGGYLNANFVSIKIDREERPDLDAQFSLVTAFLTGSSGWPNSVFLTPEGDAFYGGGYYPRDNFLGLLAGIIDIWESEPTAVRAEAFVVTNRVQGFLDQEAAVGEVNEDDLYAVATGLLDDFDAFQGGFGDAPKFPRETVLLYILDQAGRRGDYALFESVTITLDSMIAGGIYDQIGGGFHRYAIDPDWHVPHFEKMLYNQALMARVLARAYAIGGDDRYARVAAETLDYVLREMQAPTGGFFAAQDADSIGPDGEMHEGAFYLWQQDEVRAALAEKFAAGQIDAMVSLLGMDSLEGEFEAPFVNSDVLSREGTAGEFGLESGKVDEMILRLRAVRARRGAPVTDPKIILSWNGLMIATLAEVGWILGREDYEYAAQCAANFIWEEMQSEQGFARLYMEGVAQGEAHLGDLAEYGLALVALADSGEFGAGWLAKAQVVRAQIESGFHDAGSALRMTRTRQGLSVFRPLDDEGVPSPNASALAFLTGLDNRLGEFGDVTQDLAAAVAMDATMEPLQRAALLAAVSEFKAGESGSLRRSTGGVVKVSARLNAARDGVDLRMQVKDGWHINAHVPLEDYFIPTKMVVDGAALRPEAYPEAVEVMLGFNPKPLAVYEDGVELSALFGEDMGGNGHRVTLEIQACSDEICLQPDEMTFQFWP